MRDRPYGASVVAVAAAAVLAAQGACPAAASAPPIRPHPVAAAPADPSTGALLDRLRVRYHQAERATDRYRSAQRRLTAQRAKVKKLDAELAAATVRVRGNRQEAGRLARSQYRGTLPGVPPLLVLLLSDHPRAALDRQHALTHAVSSRTATLKRLTTAEHRRDALAQKARKALRRQQRLADRRKERRDEMRQRLRRVEKLLIGLSPAQRAALPGRLRAPAATGQAGATEPR